MSKPTIKKGTIKRLLSYITKNYKKQFAIVFICIIISSVASVAGSLFLQILIDDYISPLLEMENPVFTGLLKAIGTMAIIYVLGIVTSYLYNRIMVSISQGVLKKIRDEMFEEMEKLPIKYFDTHTHGDIMSHYTNDTDTLRQMISQSLPQMISSTISIIAILCGLLYLSPFLTIFVIIFSIITIIVTRKMASKSSKYFMRQQQSIRKSQWIYRRNVKWPKSCKSIYT